MRSGPLSALSLGAVWVLSGCPSERRLDGKPAPFDDGSPASVPEDSDPLPPEEACNGLDDDGDGDVDEGFPDADANGVADCLQADCSGVEVGAEGAVETNPATVPWDGPVVVDPWDVEVAWEVTEVDGAETSPFEALLLPVILPPGDPSGARVFTAATSALRGASHSARAFVLAADGSVSATYEGWTYAQNPAVADVDGDGTAEVFLMSSAYTADAIHPDGSSLWRSEEIGGGSVTATVHDLDGDGAPEVMVGNVVFDATTGEERFSLRRTACGGESSTAIADLDLDGAPEILFCDTVFDREGEPVWTSPMGKLFYSDPVVVQADADPEAEVAFIHGRMVVYDTDGTELAASAELGRPVWGPPCAGDLDGDGEMEVVVANMDTLYAFELDGTTAWAVPIDDSSSRSGCSVADLDGDGRAEVLYMDEVSFGIYEGSTGDVLFLDSTVTSGTAIQFPTTADLDGDGHTEIVIAMGDLDNTRPGTPFIRVYRNAGEGWTPGGAVWPFSSYSMVEVDEDGTVPSVPEPAWSRYGVFRGRTASHDSHPLAADLGLTVGAVCVEDCVDGPVVVSVQVTNTGTLAVPEGVSLAVYAVEGADEHLVTTTTLPALAASTAAPGFLLSLDPTGLVDATLRVVVDDDGTAHGLVREADETNNTATWEGVLCSER